MKREKFLWPLTQGHHGGLMAARNALTRLAAIGSEEGEELRELSREVSDFFKMDLKDHFLGEDGLLRVFCARAGEDDIDAARIRKEHQVLQDLAGSSKREDMRRFAELLISHIHFEEDVFFPRVEKVLGPEDKVQVEKGLLSFQLLSIHPVRSGRSR